jgi:hypothetical protein
MWRTTSLGAWFSLCIAACTSVPPSPATTAAASAAPGLPPAGCVANTATRIPLNPSDCAAFGHAWTDRDLKTTGATNAAQALRLLDPSVTVTGN